MQIRCHKFNTVIIPQFNLILGPILKQIVERASLKLNCLAGQQDACEQIVNDVQKIKDLKFYFYSTVFNFYLLGKFIIQD